MNVAKMHAVFSQSLQNDHNLTDAIPSFDIDYYLITDLNVIEIIIG